MIINPKAGGGRGKKHWLEIEKLLVQTKIPFEAAFSEYQGHSILLAKTAIEQGFVKVVAVGGDGTANEVVNGLFAQTHTPTANISFALIPVGTGNDWIKTYQIPKDYKKAVLLIQAENTRLQDIGQINFHRIDDNLPETRYFMNVAGMGYDAFVVEASLSKGRWTSNRLYYLYLILSCTLKYSSQKAKVIIDNQQVIEKEFYSMAMGICRYNGGGAQFVPHAVPDDGLFALTLVDKVSPWEVVRATSYFYNGKIAKIPQVNTYQAKHIRIEAPAEAPPIWVEADGEFLGQTPVEFILHEKALQIIVP